MTKRIEVAKAPAPLEEYVKHFDALFGKSNQRNGFRRYMEGLLLPSERHKTLTGLVNTEPVKGAQLPRAQALQWFLSEADWDERKMQACRLQLLREDPTTTPTSKGVLVIDETGDRKDGHKTAHIGRQYLGKLGKVDSGVVSVTSLWADEGVYYPVDVEPYTPAHHFEKGEDDPAFGTKLKIALELVDRAHTLRIPFRAVVADNFYGEDRTLRAGLRALKLGYVLALKPSHDWWHRVGTPGSLQEVAQAAGWKSAEQSGQWVKIERKFRDGSQQSWWALEVQAGPYGSEKDERAVIATTDPETLPDATTWHVVTNIPFPGSAAAQHSELEAASLQDIVRLYGLRMWIEQSYKHVKHALGWSQYQVRSDQAIRRHWQLVCCAFSFCWYHASHPCSSTREDAGEASESPTSQEPQVAVDMPATRKKNQHRNRISSPFVLADGAAGRTRMAGALDHAATLLASVGRHAPTTSAPMLT